MSFMSRLARARTPMIGAAAMVFGLGAASVALAQQQRPAAPATRPAAGQPATAPQAAPAPAAPASGAPAQPEIIELVPSAGQSWTKICGDKEGEAQTCFTSREFVTKDGQRGVAMAIYDISGPKPQKHVRALMPLGFKLPVGVRLNVDKTKVIAGKYDVCLPVGCYVDFESAADLIAQMKKGKTVFIDVQDPMGRLIGVSFPLEGFGAAFDGEAIKPEQLEADRKKLEEELVKKSEEMRKQLLEGDGSAAAPAAPK